MTPEFRLRIETEIRVRRDIKRENDARLKELEDIREGFWGGKK